MGDWCNCIECVGESWEPTAEEAEAIRRYENGEAPSYSTGIDDTLTCGYGNLSAEGFWEFPLPMRLVEAPNNQVERQPNIPDLTDEEWEILFHLYPELKARLQKVFDAYDAQAQPPAASVTDTLAVFEVVSGVEGPCLTISREADGKPRHEYRLAGPKPWGGGNTTHSFKVHTRELREQIDAIEAALAAQENANGL